MKWILFIVCSIAGVLCLLFAVKEDEPDDIPLCVIGGVCFAVGSCCLFL